MLDRTTGRVDRGGAATPKTSELLHDWNRDRRPAWGAVQLMDETLRDGLQAPSVRTPATEVQVALLHHMAGLGIDALNLGYPGSGAQALERVTALAREIAGQRLAISATCAARTIAADITPIAQAQQSAGLAIEAAVFLGSSPIRRYVEGWDMDFLLRTTNDAVVLARRLGMRVMYVTEDTTRSRPGDLRRLYSAAIEAGASRICLADTVGHATPRGAGALVRFARRVVLDSGEPVAIDWHGHRDRDLGVANSLAAAEAGADRLHGCALGIGERCGNTPLDLLMVNLKLLGWIQADLSGLPAYCRAVAAAVDVDIPRNYPAIGSDAFETSTGVHAAAIAKAMGRGDTWLADRVYSGVPAAELGLKQTIKVGPMSGQANVLGWLAAHGRPAAAADVGRVLEAAKKSDHVLADSELEALLPTTAAKS
jgi:2-isopropylmalate synthase